MEDSVPVSELLNLLKENGIEDPLAYLTLISIAIEPDKDMIENFWELVLPVVNFNRLTTSPFSKPTSEVDGKIRFAVTENSKPVGVNPEECHCLIAGQTGSGKSTLLKIIFAQALFFNEVG